MSLRDLNRGHLGLLGFYSMRYAVRGGVGLVFLVLVLFFGLMAANLVIERVEDFQREVGPKEAKAQLDRVVEQSMGFVEWAIGGRKDLPLGPQARAQDNPWAAYLLDRRPALLSAILLLLVFSMPLLVATGAFNQYSGDVATRGIRYLLLRTERANIYFGRFLGMVAYCAITLVILMATIILYMGLALPFYGWGELLGWGLYGLVALIVLCTPYVALCGWISGAIDSAFASLSLCALAVGGVPLFAFLGAKLSTYATYINWVIPWGVQNYLFHYQAGTVALAVLACFGYTAVFLTLGYRHFAKRDL